MGMFSSMRLAMATQKAPALTGSPLHMQLPIEPPSSAVRLRCFLRVLDGYYGALVIAMAPELRLLAESHGSPKPRLPTWPNRSCGRRYGQHPPHPDPSVGAATRRASFAEGWRCSILLGADRGLVLTLNAEASTLANLEPAHHVEVRRDRRPYRYRGARERPDG